MSCMIVPVSPFYFYTTLNDGQFNMTDENREVKTQCTVV